MPDKIALELASQISRQNVSKEGWTTYYVDGTNGNDGANGLTWESAFKTIQAAIDKGEVGTKIYVRPGTYEENLTIDKDRVRIIGDNKDTVIISPSSGKAVDIRGNCCYITGMTAICNDSGEYCFYIAKGEYNVIEDCLFDATVANVDGVGSNANYTIISKVRGAATNIEDGIFLVGNRCEISECLIENATDDGIFCAGSKCKIYDNEIVNCNDGIICGNNSENTVFHNNLIGNTTQVGGAAGFTNYWWENYYDDHTTDTNNDGLCDSPYTFTNGVDYSPVSKRNGWNQISLGTTISSDIVLEMLTRPSIYLFEGWQDEAGIDPTIWTVTDPATGTAWSRKASGAYLVATAAPNATETARLRSNQRWIAAPDTYGADTVLRKLVFEFELKLTNVANLDETLTFLGLTTAVGDDRSSNNIIGWGIASDVLQSITDNAGTETTNTTFGETLTNWNKLKIEIYSGHVKFYINETEEADHTTNLPDYPMYLNFFLDTDGAGGAATIELGIVRVWTEDIAR